jgi:hypothetical protein
MALQLCFEYAIRKAQENRVGLTERDISASGLC